MPENTSKLIDTPPDRITIACFTYMARMMELRDFYRFFYGVVDSAQDFVGILTEQSQRDFKEAALKFQNASGRLSTGRHVINEIILSRQVESFELYLVQSLRLIFSGRPDLVVEEQRLMERATKADFNDPNEYFLLLAEKKLDQLSRSGFAALNDYFSREIGIALFQNKGHYNAVALATQVRNLIAHNDCRVNEIFLKRISELPNRPQVGLGQRFGLNDVFVRSAAETLDHAVFMFDESSVAKFDLPTMGRMSSFLFRGDFARSTM